MRVVGIVAPFAPIGAGIRGKFVLSSPRGGENGQKRRVSDAPSNDTPRDSQANLRVGPVLGL